MKQSKQRTLGDYIFESLVQPDFCLYCGDVIDMGKQFCSVSCNILYYDERAEMMDKKEKEVLK